MNMVVNYKENIKNQHSTQVSADFFLTNKNCRTKLPVIRRTEQIADRLTGYENG